MERHDSPYLGTSSPIGASRGFMACAHSYPKTYTRTRAAFAPDGNLMFYDKKRTPTAAPTRASE